MKTLANAFPFHKLKQEKYLIIEVIMYLKHGEASKFMFSLNKESRKFLEDNFITIHNGFENEGLLPCYFLSTPRFFDNFSNY